MKFQHNIKCLVAAILSLSTVAACHRGSSNDANQDQHLSSGQVSNKSAQAVSKYAAARFAEQASFGPTPALVEEISQSGLTVWLDQQLSMPVKITPIPSSIITFDLNNNDDVERTRPFANDDFWKGIVTEPDQLRRRVAWSIFQYIPILDDNFPAGRADYFNLMLRNAFGNYGTLLREVTLHPMMGKTLNNNLNRPASAQCLGCAPNENYARELLQLFSVGVVQLNSDGSIIRDAEGKAKETYSQKDVEELARALTGWRYNNVGITLPNSNWLNVTSPMVSETNASLHDSGSKTIMGVTIKAGLNADQDLDAVIDLLMKHPNTAPFVSLRLIQHLVTSNPSPAYIGRIAAVFRDNGNGVTGDLKAVVRAILLDPEARRGDQINSDKDSFGKIREPVLWLAALQRGLNCKTPIYGSAAGYLRPVAPQGQDKEGIPSIFSFYQATDRAPESNLLSPEQQLLSNSEFNTRLNNLSWFFIAGPTATLNRSNSGCEIDAMFGLYRESAAAYIEFINQRWFRGAMPNALRNQLMSSIQTLSNSQNREEDALSLLQYALSTPYFGVQQ